MGSFYDAVDSFFGNKYRRKGKEKGKAYNIAKPTFTVVSFIEGYRQHGIIETKTFTYMRGRTLSDTLVVVD